MSVRSINDSINSKMTDTNKKIDKSVEIRRNYHDKDYQKQLADFDKAFLTEAEKEKINQLNEAETSQLKESNKYAAKTALNGVKVAAGGVIGKAFGTISAADNSQKLGDSEVKLGDISDARDQIRSAALERQTARYEMAKEAASGIKTDSEKTDEMEVHSNGRY